MKGGIPTMITLSIRKKTINRLGSFVFYYKNETILLCNKGINYYFATKEPVLEDFSKVSSRKLFL